MVRAVEDLLAKPRPETAFSARGERNQRFLVSKVKEFIDWIGAEESDEKKEAFRAVVAAGLAPPGAPDEKTDVAADIVDSPRAAAVDGAAKDDRIDAERIGNNF